MSQTRIGVLGSLKDQFWLEDDVVLAAGPPTGSASIAIQKIGNVITFTIEDTPTPTKLEYKKTHPDARIPYKSRSTDIGYDLASIQDAIIPPHDMTNFATGLIVSAPPGYYYTIDGRSSLWSKGIVPARGIIDSAYIGDLKVALFNISDLPYEVHAGDRIAQLVLHRMLEADFVEVSEFSPEYSTRGTSGFGSSGA